MSTLYKRHRLPRDIRGARFCVTLSRACAVRLYVVARNTKLAGVGWDGSTSRSGFVAMARIYAVGSV